MDSNPISYTIIPTAGLIGRVKRALRDEGLECFESGAAGLSVCIDPSAEAALHEKVARVHATLQSQLNMRAFVYGLRQTPKPVASKESPGHDEAAST
jgi:hypothetical protein